MEPFKQKGYSMASWSTFIFKSVEVIAESRQLLYNYFKINELYGNFYVKGTVIFQIFFHKLYLIHS